MIPKWQKLAPNLICLWQSEGNGCAVVCKKLVLLTGLTRYAWCENTGRVNFNGSCLTSKVNHGYSCATTRMGVWNCANWVHKFLIIFMYLTICKYEVMLLGNSRFAMRFVTLPHCGTLGLPNEINELQKPIFTSYLMLFWLLDISDSVE